MQCYPAHVPCCCRKDPPEALPVYSQPRALMRVVGGEKNLIRECQWNFHDEEPRLRYRRRLYILSCWRSFPGIPDYPDLPNALSNHKEGLSTGNWQRVKITLHDTAAALITTNHSLTGNNNLNLASRVHTTAACPPSEDWLLLLPSHSPEIAGDEGGKNKRN